MKIRVSRTSFYRNLIFVMAKGNMNIGGHHASGSSRMLNNSEVKNTSCKQRLNVF